MEAAIVKHEQPHHNDYVRVLAVFVTLVVLSLMGLFVRIQTAKPKTSETTKAKIATLEGQTMSLQEQLDKLLEGQKEIKHAMGLAMKNGTAQRDTIIKHIEEIDREIDGLKP